MSAILRLKDENGVWHDVPAIRGLSAYQLAVKNGYTKSEAEWLASVTGVKGDTGDTGKSAYQSALDAGFVGSEAEWVASLKGAKGDTGAAGSNGKSAYQSAVDGGYEGSENDWVNSLKGTNGTNGKSAYQSALDTGFVGSETDWVASLKASDPTIVEKTITSSSWGETVTITHANITATNNVAMIPGKNITSDQLKALQKANCQDCGTQAVGSITFKVFGTVPTIDIPVRLVIGGVV